MKKLAIVLILLIATSVLLSSCLPAQTTAYSSTSALIPATGNHPAPTTTGQIFIPGSVLAELPVYPGATPTTFLGYPYIGVPMSYPAYIGATPGYQSAMAQYEVQDGNADNILIWYADELLKMGYLKDSGESTSGGGRPTEHGVAFLAPSRPLVEVEIHVYDKFESQTFSEVLELLVTYTVPLPKPLGGEIPSDVNSIDATYYPGGRGSKTITDPPTVQRLLAMVNTLNVSPGYLILGGLETEPKTVFQLKFHSASKGPIIVTNVVFVSDPGIRISGYGTILEDRHWLLTYAVSQLFGITTYPPPLP